ncbi:MAG: DUF1997 domain-containing protein [Rhodanobacteraceae bacterium]
MSEHASDLSLQTSQRAFFALPCVVARGIAYLSDPAIVLGALPSVERVILRPHGTYRLTLAPIHVPGVSLRPAAEVRFATTDSQVAVRSVAEEPNDLQPGEVAARVVGLFALTPTATGCGVHASLRIAARVPAHLLPSLMPRIIAQRTAEAVLIRRMKQEVQMMTRTLVRGYSMWEGSEFGVRGSRFDE